VNIKSEISDVAETFENKLRMTIANGGCSAYDNFRHLYGKAYAKRYRQHSYARWTFRERSSKTSISYEARNRTPYAKYIYTDTPSLNTYHPNGYVSAYPHVPIKYRGIEYNRDNQVTKKSFDACFTTLKRQMKAAIKRGLKKR
jgi:hypothetical protein